MTYVSVPGNAPTFAPHPVVTGFNGIEPKFVFDELIQTAIVINSECAILHDAEREIIRFVNMTSYNYCIMARDVNAIGRPDITLPWGHFRLRAIMSPGVFRYVHYVLNDAAMDDILYVPINSYVSRGVGFYINSNTIKGFYKTTIPHQRYSAMIEKLSNEITALAYRKAEEDDDDAEASLLFK